MIVSAGGTDIADSGVAVGNVTVLKGGTLELVGGNISGNTTLPKLPAGAILALGFSQVLSSYTVSSGITLKIFWGGADISATISNGGTAIVTSGATDSDATILKGGTRLSPVAASPLTRPYRAAACWWCPPVGSPIRRGF